MSLIAFQTALGRSVRAGPARFAHDDLDLSAQERRDLARMIDSDGFRITAGIQRSWCEGRTANGARLTLSVLPLVQRRELVGEWVDGGGGTHSFFTVEANRFLDFLAERLPAGSHALSLCRLERAVLRAEATRSQFKAPDAASLASASLLRRGSYAAMVTFLAEPEALLRAVTTGAALPPVSTREHMLLIAPGVPGLGRPPGPAEIALWRSMNEPQAVAELEQTSGIGAIEALWIAGALEAA